MCRNIRTLHNFEPLATDEEIRASALQFVRKLSGFTRPSKANEAAFSRAVEQVAQAAHELLDALGPSARRRDRGCEGARARPRAAALCGVWPPRESPDGPQPGGVPSFSFPPWPSFRPARAGAGKK